MENSKELKNKEKLYKQYVDSYYQGTPLIDDDTFDQFQEELIQLGSKLPLSVGYESTITEKFSHITPMLSLSKIKAKKNTEPPTEEFLKWIKKTQAKLYLVEPKYDGNSVNVIYKNGKLWKALSRTDSKVGTEITDVVKHHVPNVLKAFAKRYNVIDDVNIEVRGEMLIKKSVFKKKYSQFANERNYIAGVLHRSDVSIEEINDLVFIPCEVKLTSTSNVFFGWVENVNEWCLKNGFKNISKISLEISEWNKSSFSTIFNRMLEYRDLESDFLLDGFVVKVAESKSRNELGENSHDPEWAKAIKFEPKGVIAKINSIEFTLGKKRELVPIAQLEPVELGGTIVKKCSLYNISWIKEMKCFPGASVELVKAGDIIPQILSVIEESSNLNYQFPENCPACNSKVTKTDINYYCSNDECSGAGLKKFAYAVKHFGFDFFGIKTMEKIYQNGLTNPFDLFNTNKFNKEFLVGKAGFTNGASSERLLSEVNKIKSLNLEQLILGLNIDNCGETISKQVALYMANAPSSFFGLEEEVVKYLLSKEGQELILKTQTNLENFGIKVIYPTVQSQTKTNKNIIMETIEFTGSPREMGFKTKEEFLSKAKEFGFEHSKLDKNCKYLVTDSYDSSSSKMAKAEKLGVEIITYSDFINKYEK